MTFKQKQYEFIKSVKELIDLPYTEASTRHFRGDRHVLHLWRVHPPGTPPIKYGDEFIKQELEEVRGSRITTIIEIDFRSPHSIDGALEKLKTSLPTLKEIWC